jgi:hypothetical protein
METRHSFDHADFGEDYEIRKPQQHQLDKAGFS